MYGHKIRIHWSNGDREDIKVSHENAEIIMTLIETKGFQNSLSAFSHPLNFYINYNFVRKLELIK